MAKLHDDGEMIINAEPTKELFIAMLTRDVALIPAIIDLVDNSTDGARRLHNGNSWDGLTVKVQANPNKFVVVDNCGGMTVETAREYAFRFGRPDDVDSKTGEVGRFGVGMKRGLFKLGKQFHIKSTTATSQFEVSIDVDSWSKLEEWQFEFDRKPIEGGQFEPEEQGTTISVTDLHRQVSDHFKDDVFIEELRRQLTSKLEESICQGLVVQVNDVSLKAHFRELVSTPELAPARKRFKLKGGSGGQVDVELWCGLGKPSLKQAARAEAGWYVFCNGRMLLEADKTAATGWGIEDDEKIPAYHPQFNDFRGFAYLDAADGADLPWNTTKTALDTDHPVYRRVKQEMIAIARPVIDYFNKRKEENETLKEAGETPRGQLQKMFDNASMLPLAEIKPRAVFIVPTPKISRRRSSAKTTQQISFEREVDKANRVKETLAAGTWREVGEAVFDYFYNAEIGDE